MSSAGGMFGGGGSGGGGIEWASTFATFLGAGMQANAAQISGKSVQRLNEYNAQIAEIKADDAIVRGSTAETQLRTKAKGMIGASRAAFAAGGVDVNDSDSTAVNVQKDIAALSEIDALTIRANAAREAWGYKTSATDLRSRGSVAKQEADMKSIGFLTSAAGSVLYNKYGFGSTSRYTAG